MKPALFLSAPLLAFFAAALLARLVPPLDPTPSAVHPTPSGPRKPAGVIENSKSASSNIESTLSKMERRVVQFSPSKIEVFDADGMESRLLLDRLYSPTGGLEAVNYSRRWAAENPAEIFKWFIRRDLVPSDMRKSLVEWLFFQWAKQDMPAALAAVTRVSHAEYRAQALVSTLEVLCQTEPVKARDLLLQNIDLLGALKSVEFEEFEPGKTRTQLILSLPSGRLRSLLMAENIRCLMYRGFGCGGDDSSYYAKAAFGTGLWNQLSTDERRELVGAGLHLSEFDKIQLDGLEDLIKQRAEASNDPRQAYRFIERYSLPWAERYAAADVSWTMAHLKGKERMVWSLILLADAAEKDFDAAMRIWRTLPQGTLREEAAKRLAEKAPADHEVEKALLQDSAPKPGKW